MTADADTLEYQLVETPAALEECVALLRGAPEAALDTEADSLHHYFQKVCLIQISVQNRHFVVDPLARMDLKPLLDALRPVNLILHGADYDLRMLRLSYDFTPEGEVFDTMLAAQLLGYEPFGLAALVERHFSVVLAKDCQKWDWSRRPLEERHLRYAANDTRYLHELSAQMRGELARLGRLEWLRENCRQMARSAISAAPREKGDPDAWRIKGSNKLPARTQALLKALWEWREEQAREADLPSFKVLNNQMALDIVTFIAAEPGRTLDQFERLPRNLRGRRKDELREILAAAAQGPLPPRPKPDPARRRGPAWTGEDEKTLAVLQQARDTVAVDLKLNPSVLAPRSALQEIVRERPATRENMTEKTRLLHWQADLLAPVCLPLLNQ